MGGGSHVASSQLCLAASAIVCVQHCPLSASHSASANARTDIFYFNLNSICITFGFNFHSIFIQFSFNLNYIEIILKLCLNCIYIYLSY